MGRDVVEGKMDIVRIDHHQKTQLRIAAFRATRLYPGPVGELLHRELLDWEVFGYRFGGGAFMTRLIDHLTSAPLPPSHAA